MQLWMHLLNNVALERKSIGSSSNSLSHALKSSQNMFVWYIECCTLDNHVRSFRARHLMKFNDRLGEKLYMYYIRIICLVLLSYKCNTMFNNTCQWRVNSATVSARTPKTWFWVWKLEPQQLRYWILIVNCAYPIHISRTSMSPGSTYRSEPEASSRLAFSSPRQFDPALAPEGN